tara:strand:+ start:665 stop:1045 length:381 start_codon:yes stop_codon:yes gene_type:complete
MRKQVLIISLDGGFLIISKVSVEGDVQERVYARPGKIYLLEDPLGISYNSNPNIDPKEDTPFSVIDILVMSDTNEIKIHEDKVAYFYPPSPDIIHQYNQVLLSKLEPIPGNEEEEEEELVSIVDTY